MPQETLTVKFGGQAHQVDVQTFALSVLNFATVIKEINRQLGSTPVDIHIKAPSEGSVLVDLIATATTTASHIDSLLPDIPRFVNLITVVGAMYGLHKFVSGRSIKEKKEKEREITITLDDGSQMTIAEQVYNIYVNVPSIANGISQNFSALSEDPAVSEFIVSNKGKDIISVKREDYSRLAIKQQFETENSKKIIESANLYIYKVVFDKTDRKWEFYHGGNRISANITDEDFFKHVDAGESFAKGDQLRADLQITQILDESVGIYVNQSYQIVKVHEHIKRSEPQKLPFNKNLE